jgi:aryl-alcohol dehydrogenase-like predicted oxidoreductase
MLFISSKAGYVPEDADRGIPSSVLIEQLIDDGQIEKEDVAGGIHCMHPNFLKHQLDASRDNLGVETIDLVYLQNAFEQQAHFLPDT